MSLGVVVTISLIEFYFIMIFIMVVVTIIGIFMAIHYILDYTLGYANAQLPGCSAPGPSP